MHLAVVIDLFSRHVVGWAMRDRADAEVVVQALLSAVWRRKPKPGVLVRSDQGSVYTSDDWRKFLSAHGLVCSMSRRSGCHHNAQAKSFFGLLKRVRAARRATRVLSVYGTLGDSFKPSLANHWVLTTQAPAKGIHPPSLLLGPSRSPRSTALGRGTLKAHTTPHEAPNARRTPPSRTSPHDPHRADAQCHGRSSGLRRSRRRGPR